MIFGLKIRQLRVDKNLSQADVAKTMGISVSYLNEIEKGKKYPKANKIADMAVALGVSYDWLVSLQLTANLSPIAELLKSDLLTSLPSEIFGIEPSTLMDIVANTNTKITAFVSTLIELARNYNINIENFYFSVLRSYQEMHENYFEDLEIEVEKFLEENPIFKQKKISLEGMKAILIEKYDYEIDEQSLANYSELRSLRSVLLPQSKKNKLLLNNTLSDTQKIFTLGREIGYNFMRLKDRAYTSSWVKIQSFEQLLNNFRASYFSGALLIPKQDLIADLKAFITLKTWQPENLLALMQKYHASPEMFAHRLTGIVPKFFGLNQLFFLRFNHQQGSDVFELDKELHLAGLYNPHGNMINEDYCRRWISLNILKDLDKIALNQTQAQENILCQAQVSQYYDSPNEYLCISIARGFSPTPNNNSSVTIGFLMNGAFKKQVKFWNDANIPVRKVGVTCQRCSATDCYERTAPPSIYEQLQKTENLKNSLAKLMSDFGK